MIPLVALSLYIGGSTCLAILAIYLLGRIFYSSYKNIKTLTLIGALASIPIVYKYTDLLNDSGRFQNWLFYFNQWVSNANNMIIGTGIGSFKNMATKLATPSGNYFVYAHNDFLEMFLETGVLGLSVFLYLCWLLLKMAKDAKMLHIVLMMFVFMFNYFPNQILLMKLVFVLTIVEIYYERERLSARNS
jgi:O-antigen ligase